VAKSKKPPPKRAASGGHAVALAVVFKTVLAVALVGVLVGGLGFLGDWSARRLAKRERYAVKVADIQVALPPDLERSTFLTEVRYLGELPETVQAVDPDLGKTLRAAFLKHPWVAEVTAVTVSPERVIGVELTVRRPVLSVTLKGEAAPRAVDASGVLLPLPAVTNGLPVLANVQPDAVIAGQPFASPDVKRAAELVATYPTKRIERTTEGWRLTAPDDTVRVIVTQ
jgi:hypothetical protein